MQRVRDCGTSWRSSRLRNESPEPKLLSRSRVALPIRPLGNTDTRRRLSCVLCSERIARVIRLPVARQGNSPGLHPEAKAIIAGRRPSIGTRRYRSVDRREDRRSLGVFDGEFPQAVEVVGEDLVSGMRER